MPAPIKVDKDQVRMLVLAVGVREAARKLGLKEDTVAAWSARGDWLAVTRPQAAQVPLPASMVSASSASKSPVQALQAALADDERETRVSLSRGTRRAAAKLEDAKPEDASNLLTLAKTHALVHRLDSERGPAVAVNIAILGQSDQELIRKV